jgi:AcrR family transcriptional regulator
MIVSDRAMLPAAMPPDPEAPPEGESGATEHHRVRALCAMAGAVGERGYAATTVSDVLERASMSRRTFYRLFANREECFLAAYDVARDEALALVPPSPTADASEWAAHVEQALRQLLRYLARHPDRARLLMVEPLAVGAPGLDRHEATMRELGLRLSPPRPRARDDLELQAAVGAVHRVVQARIAGGRGAGLPRLAPALAAALVALHGDGRRPQR